MERPVAIIDLGTNTFNLLIAVIGNEEPFKKVYSHRIPVMLGEGTINAGFLSDQAIERGIAALKIFAVHIQQFNVLKIVALATSAIRTASNSTTFVNRAKSETGIDIQVISGSQEAELIFLGNAAAANLGTENSLIMDIGGGSTEFIISNRNGILWKESYLLGAARIIHRFQPEDPISAATQSKINLYLEQELKSLSDAVNIFPVTELIGSSGAFDSFVELIETNFSSMQLSEEKKCYQYNINEYYQIADSLIVSTKEERKNRKGLIPMRVEMIVVATLLINFVLEKFKIVTLRSTTWSLKEGALLQIKNGNKI